MWKLMPIVLAQWKSLLKLIWILLINHMIFLHEQIMIYIISSGLGYIGKRSDWLKGDLATLRGLWSYLRRLDLTQRRYLGHLIPRESPEVSDGRQSAYIRHQNCSKETSCHLSVAYAIFMFLNLSNYLSGFNKCRVSTVAIIFISLYNRKNIQSSLNDQINGFHTILEKKYSINGKIISM